MKLNTFFAVSTLATSFAFAGIPPATAPSAEAPAPEPVSMTETVVIKTNYGEITVELNREKAPITVSNFLAYADSGFYENTIFHRVIKNFMIQGGGFDTAMNQKKTNNPIKNEATNGLANNRGTIAMARTGVINSATAQFFINTVDNSFLNFRNESIQGYGYAVFGKVINGMEVVDAIAATKTSRMMGMSDVPTQPVVIQSIKRK